MTNSDESERKPLTVVDKTVEHGNGTSTYTIECDNGEKYQEIVNTNIFEGGAAPTRKLFILNAEIGDKVEESILEEK